jgi:hypothetical protein
MSTASDVDVTLGALSVHSNDEDEDEGSSATSSVISDYKVRSIPAVVFDEPSHIDTVAPNQELAYDFVEFEKWPSKEDGKGMLDLFRITNERRKAHPWIAQLPEFIVVKTTLFSDMEDDIEPGKQRAFREIQARVKLGQLGDRARPYYAPLVAVLVSDKPFTGHVFGFKDFGGEIDHGAKYLVPFSELLSDSPSEPVKCLCADNMNGVRRRLRGLVLGYEDGGKGNWYKDLDSAKARGRMDAASPAWQAVMAQWRDALTGLGMMHEAGILHNDVKASNIVRASDTHAVLIDFEHALFVDEEEDSWAFEVPKTEDAAIRTVNALDTTTWMFGTPERVAYGPYRFSRDLYAMALSMFELIVPGAVAKAVQTQDGRDDPRSPDHAFGIAVDELFEYSDQALEIDFEAKYDRLYHGFLVPRYEEFRELLFRDDGSDGDRTAVLEAIRPLFDKLLDTNRDTRPADTAAMRVLIDEWWAGMSGGQV